MTLMLTGATSFIDTNFVLDWLAESKEAVINLDKLTCAGNLQTLASLPGDAGRNRSAKGVLRGLHSQYERCIAWNDPAIGIRWPADAVPQLSAKDMMGKSLIDAEVFP